MVAVNAAPSQCVTWKMFQRKAFLIKSKSLTKRKQYAFCCYILLVSWAHQSDVNDTRKWNISFVRTVIFSDLRFFIVHSGVCLLFFFLSILTLTNHLLIIDVRKKWLYFCNEAAGSMKCSRHFQFDQIACHTKWFEFSRAHLLCNERIKFRKDPKWKFEEEEKKTNKISKRYEEKSQSMYTR